MFDDFLVDLPTVGAHLLRLATAFFLALPIGWNREQSRSANLGMRTFPLVSMASCAYVLLGQVVLAEELAAQARILQGLITGVGFLGGGAILKDSGNVRGTATAAAIWGTAALGAATAYGRLEIAVSIAFCTFVVLAFMPSVQEKIREGTGVEPKDEK